MCGWLANGGNQSITPVLLGTALVPGAQVPTLAAGLGLLALNAACAYDPAAGPTSNGTYCTGAAEATGLFIKPPGQAEQESLTLYGVTIATERRVPAEGRHYFRFNGSMGPNGQNPVTSGETWYTTSQTEYVRYGPSKLKVTSCTLPPSTPQPNAPVTYVDPETTCTYKVEHQAWQMHGDGRAGAILKISSVQQARASGGVISGCNWDPILYITPPSGGGGGGGVITPWQPLPDGPDGPWWLDLAKETAAEFLANSLKSLIEGLLDKRTTPVVYRLNTVCEVDADGEPINSATEIDIPSTDQLSSVVNRLDALSLLLQAHKDYRQPICYGKPTSGRLVTIQFQSDASVIPSKNSIRKTLSYRDQTGKTLAEHEAHWAQFSWDAGPVVVGSRGLPWGKPAVWASTEAEGRRVISHAAAVAGVDLNAADHRWAIGATKDARYGRMGKVYPVKWDATSRLMVSMRDGPSGMPDWRRDP